MFTMLTVIILFCGTTDVLLEPSFMRFWVNERNLHCSQALWKLWQPAETWHPASSQILSPLSSPSLLCTWPDKRNHRWMGLTVQSCQKLNRSFLNNKVGAFICLQSRILAVTTKVIEQLFFFNILFILLLIHMSYMKKSSTKRNGNTTEVKNNYQHYWFPHCRAMWGSDGIGQWEDPWVHPSTVAAWSCDLGPITSLFWSSVYHLQK